MNTDEVIRRISEINSIRRANIDANDRIANRVLLDIMGDIDLLLEIIEKMRKGQESVLGPSSEWKKDQENGLQK